GQAADLEQQDRLAKLHHRELHVRGLPLIGAVVRESPTKAVDLRGQRATLDTPAGNVDLVYALVADFAVAKVPKPMPCVGMQVGMKRLHRSRANPQVVVKIRRRRRDRAKTNAGPAVPAAATLAGAAAADN